MQEIDETQILKNAEKNKDFIDKNFKSLESKYPNQFVVVSGAQLIESANTPDEALKVIEEKKINRSDVLVEFIPLPGAILIL